MQTELSEPLPFQSLFGWFMVSPSGQTKDLVRKIYLGILSKNLVLKFNLFTEFFLQFKRTFLVPHVKLPFLMHLIA